MKIKEIINNTRKEKVIEKENLKNNEDGILNQQRQEKIDLLNEKKVKLEGLLSDLRLEYGIAKGAIKEFTEASAKITEVFDEDKAEPLEQQAIKEKSKEGFIKAVRLGDYGKEVSEGEESEIKDYDEQGKKVRKTMAKTSAIADLRKAIKKELPDAKLNFRGVDRDKTFSQIDNEILGVAKEITNLVKEGLIARHIDGSVKIYPDDLKDLKILGQEDVENIILEQAKKLTEEKRSKESTDIELLEKDISEINFLERDYLSFEKTIQEATELSFSARIDELTDLADSKYLTQSALGLIAQEFAQTLSYGAIMGIFTDGQPKRTTREIRIKVFQTIKKLSSNFDKELRDAELAPQGKKVLFDTGKLNALKKKLEAVKEEAVVKIQELRNLPLEEKYIINLKAEDLLAKEKQWREKQRTGKGINDYLKTKKENINLVADREKILAEISLGKNFLSLENQATEKESGEAYNKVDEYYKKVKSLQETAKKLEDGMGRYSDNFSIDKDEILLMPSLDQQIKELTQEKEKENEKKEKVIKTIKDFSGKLLGKTRFKKEIESANEEIKKIDGNFKHLDNGLAEMRKIKKSSQEKFIDFLGAIPKEWINNEKISEAIFKKHEKSSYGGALTNVLSTMEHFPQDFGIISKNDLEAFGKVNQTKSALERSIEKQKQAENSLAKTQDETARLEIEYLT